MYSIAISMRLFARASVIQYSVIGRCHWLRNYIYSKLLSLSSFGPYISLYGFFALSNKQSICMLESESDATVAMINLRRLAEIVP